MSKKKKKIVSRIYICLWIAQLRSNVYVIYRSNCWLILNKSLSFFFFLFFFFFGIYQESNLIMLKASKSFLFYYFWHKIRSISCEVWSWNVTYFQLYKWMLTKICFTNCIKGYATSTFKWIKSELHKIGRVW